MDASCKVGVQRIEGLESVPSRYVFSRNMSVDAASAASHVCEYTRMGYWAFDILGAFLTVPQREELYVRQGDVIYHVLKCLPGQQLAPVYWFDQLGGDLGETNLEGNVACPVVFGGENQGAAIHVDDDLLGGLESVVNATVETLETKYKLGVSPPLKQVGDSAAIPEADV